MNNWLKGSLLGGIVGFLVWLYDYDFFINFGGPETPISDIIRDWFGFGYGVSFNSIIFPLIFLVIVFAIVGLIVGLVANKFKQN